MMSEKRKEIEVGLKNEFGDGVRIEYEEQDLSIQSELRFRINYLITLGLDSMPFRDPSSFRKRRIKNYEGRYEPLWNKLNQLQITVYSREKILFISEDLITKNSIKSKKGQKDREKLKSFFRNKMDDIIVNKIRFINRDIRKAIDEIANIQTQQRAILSEIINNWLSTSAKEN